MLCSDNVVPNTQLEDVVCVVAPAEHKQHIRRTYDTAVVDGGKCQKSIRSHTAHTVKCWQKRHILPAINLYLKIRIPIILSKLKLVCVCRCCSDRFGRSVGWSVVRFECSHRCRLSSSSASTDIHEKWTILCRCHFRLTDRHRTGSASFVCKCWCFVSDAMRD